ncbi:MAG: cohesin domain-containing protein [Parcubacteria group bacterium]
MKKHYAIISIVVCALAMPMVCSAVAKATISFLPDKYDVAAGQSFNVGIIVDPAGGTLDTVRAMVKYPADKLKAEIFSLGYLYPTAAPGNFIDNEKGILSQGGTKLGGQVKAKGVFGYATFTALKKGKAVISLTSDSKLIRAGVERINKLSLGQATISVGEQISEVRDIVVQSATNPDEGKWYASANVELSWQKAEGIKDILKYFYDLNQYPSADPSIAMNASDGKKTFSGLKDGAWYFHIKGQYVDSSFSVATHYALKIDATPPNRIMPDFEKKIISEDENGIVHFATIDQTSGISHYEAAIDNGAFQTEESPYVLPRMKAGEHIVFVKALDNAGNFAQTGVKLRVLPGGRAKWFDHWKIMAVFAFAGLAVAAFFAMKIRKNKKTKITP